MVQDEWNKTQQIRPEIELDQFVIMPNHFHAIIWIHDGRGTARRAPTDEPTHEHFGKPVAGSIPTIVRAFKSAVTRQINLYHHTPGAPVWQCIYYEHIIRNETEMNAVREYIANNPQQWTLDAEYRPG
jgi:REP element-mobilizing transposase RayT